MSPGCCMIWVRSASRRAFCSSRGDSPGKNGGRSSATPTLGAEILGPAKFPVAVIAAVRHHHEDYGGGGYPAGLVGENIPLPARILRVADAYDAMTSARAYRGALTPEAARNELRRWTGRQFDPHVVEAFLQLPGEEIEGICRSGGSGALITLLAEVLTSLPHPAT